VHQVGNQYIVVWKIFQTKFQLQKFKYFFGNSFS